MTTEYTFAFLIFNIIVQTTLGQSPLYIRSTLTHQQIIKLNEPVVVPIGRRVYLSRDKHLNIDVGGRDDRCTVRVIRSDPLSEVPGELSSDEFQCEFGTNEVFYSHFGSSVPTLDQVKLLVRYDTPEETIIIPIVMRIKVTFEPLKVVSKNITLKVERSVSISDPIDSNNLKLTYRRGVEQCNVAMVKGRRPSHGQVINLGPGKYVECDKFIQLGVKYKRKTGQRSPKLDYIPFKVELRNQSDDLLYEEHFQVSIYQ